MPEGNASDLNLIANLLAILAKMDNPADPMTNDVLDRAARLLGTVSPVAGSTWDVSDRVARLLGIIYGDVGQLRQNAARSAYTIEETPTAINVLVDVTAAAAATQLIAASTPCRAVVVRALRANTGNIRVGGAGVLVGSGEELSAGDSVCLAISNVNLVYVFGNGTDKVSILYLN